MLDNAVSENAADLMLEMYEAVDTGRLQNIEPRSTQNDDADHVYRVRPGRHVAVDRRARGPLTRIDYGKG